MLSSSFSIRFQMLLGFLAAVSLLASVSGCASDPSGPARLRMATATEGGTYHRIGKELAGGVARGGFRTPITAVPSRGTEENLDLLRAGTVDLALVTQEAISALPESDREKVCVVGPLYRGGAQFILRRALVRSGDVSDLKGVHFYPGAAGGGTESSTLTLLGVLGIEPDYVPPNARRLGYEESAAALAEGRFDAVVLSGGPPVAAAAKLFEAYPRKFVLLAFTPEQLAKATDEITGLYPTEIEAGTYAGHDAPVPTVGKQTVLAARSDLDADLMNRLQETIEAGVRESGQGLRKAEAHPMLRSLTPEFWNQPIGIHRCGRNP